LLRDIFKRTLLFLPVNMESLLIARDPDDYVCHSERASDYYGLGVRLGIYFAWLHAYLANVLVPSQISGALTTNTVFLLTLLVAMTNDSNTDALSQIDGLILMHLCSGTIFGILSLWGYRTRLYTQNGRGAIESFGAWGTHIRMVTALCVSCYGIWFWIHGVTGNLNALGPGDGIEPPNSEECSTLYTFFFAKVKAAGGIRYYYIVMSTGSAVYFGAMLLTSSLSAWFTLERLLGSLHSRWSRAADIHKLSRPIYVTGFTQRELVVIHKFLRFANLFWLIFSAITVEVTLNFNHVGDVLGGMGRENTLSLPGQLLPFLVGLLGFCQLLYTIFVEKYINKQPAEVKALEAMIEASLNPVVPDPNSPNGKREPGVDESAAENDAEGNQRAAEEHLASKELNKPTLIRYLVAWLPWLSLLRNYDEELLEQGISRQGTGFNSVMASPTSPRFGALTGQTPTSATFDSRVMGR
jgi:hypothetical protein